MKQFLKKMTTTALEGKQVHAALLFFRIIVSLELIIVHGFKKIGIGVEVSEMVPNPLGLPEGINEFLAISANIGFPVFIILGVFTRLSVLPILAVTLTGYFILHAHDALLIKDVPFMYSVFFLFILIIGPGKYSIDAFIHKKISP
ncbi:DoxX family protein [Mariniflexile litorale]|uniref:DoxX family protein n=1 Tax=Mariniflexile litorale TaxID=3045158 RepID=A0AAU7EGU8_9FLAO|nr:DoxX family protein [Mariniflexile sp. KMM 9835]MDQ8211981.1 DoxX family protein [Mariniflexile sp. KMM 9835]